MYQSALVKLLGNPGLLSIHPSDRSKVRIHPQDKMCLLADAGNMVKLKDGSNIEGSILEANQTIVIKPNVRLSPSKYHALVSYTPQLALRGALVSPLSTVVRPGEEDMVGLLIRTSKKLDMSEIGHVFELYLID